MLSILFSVLFLHVHAQQSDIGHEISIYKNAMQYADYEAAKNAVYSIIEKHPENNSYLDTLTRLYFAMGANNQTIMAGNTCLKKDSGNKDIMEMVAIANANLSRHMESMEMYKRLQAKTHSPYFAYQVAFHEYRLNNYEESSKTLEGIVLDAAADSQYITITMGQDRSQRVPLKAAALNLLGVVQLQLHQDDKAKNNFDAALKLQPDFVLARENKAIADKAEEEKKNNTGQVPSPAEKK